MIKRLLAHVGRRGQVIGILGLVALAFGLGNLNNPPAAQARANAQLLHDLMPLWAWYGLWTAAGIVCLVSMFWKRAEPAAVALFSLACVSYSVGHLMADLLNMPGVNRAWILGVLLAGLARVMVIVGGWPVCVHEVEK